MSNSANTATQNLPFMPSATREPGAAVLITLAVACLLVDAMGVLALLGMDILRIGYRHRGDLGTAGWEIWGLPKLLLWLGLIAWALWLVLLVVRVVRRRKPALARTGRWAIGLALAALMLAPGWSDLQIRHYDGPSQSWILMLGNNPLPLLGYTTESDVTAGPDGTSLAGQRFVCVNSSRWKFLGVELRRSFYPSLDDAHEQALLQAHCRMLADAQGDDD